MWTQVAYAIVLTDYWLRIRRSGALNSKAALCILLDALEKDRARDQAPGREERAIKGQMMRAVGERT